MEEENYMLPVTIDKVLHRAPHPDYTEMDSKKKGGGAMI
jgi:hypothetical protein